MKSGYKNTASDNNNHLAKERGFIGGCLTTLKDRQKIKGRLLKFFKSPGSGPQQAIR